MINPTAMIQEAASRQDATLSDGTKVPDPGAFPTTQIGLADRVAFQHADRIRYIPKLRSWASWDESRWVIDDADTMIRQMIRITIDGLEEEAMLVDQGRQQEFEEFASRCQTARTIADTVSILQADPKMLASVDDFDRCPELFNVQNGTIDLRDGTIRDHRREDMITRVSPFRFQKDCKSDLWTRFLHDTLGDDEELVEWLQLFAGYCLTGETADELFGFVHGPGGSGKSTFVDAVMGVMGARDEGGYATSTPFYTWLKQGNTGKPRDDLATLLGSRLVLSSEVEADARLDAATLKSCSGGDRVSCRHLRGRYFTYRPEFKIVMVGNDAPRVSADDDGLWRRMRVIPFDRAVPLSAQDPDLKRRICSEPNHAQAVLAWAVEGARRWYSRRAETGRRGLEPAPSRVLASTRAYREDVDEFAMFLDERFEQVPGAKLAVTEIQQQHRDWARVAGQSQLSPTAIGRALTAAGFEKQRLRLEGRAKQVVYLGLALRRDVAYRSSRRA